MPPGLTDLPEELLELVVSFLDGISTLRIASSCSILRRIATQKRVWQTLRKRSNLVTVSREVQRELSRRSKESGETEEKAVSTIRNTFFLCQTLRKNWGSGVVKEKILLDEKFSGLELGYWASPCARASAASVAVVCDSLNEEVLRPGNLSEPRPASLRIWELANDKLFSPEIRYNSLSYHAHFVLDDFVVVMGRMNHAEMSSQSLIDMMVVSIQDQKILFTKEKSFNIQNFMRGFEQDSRVFKNTIASFRQTTITLHEVKRDNVTMKILDVGDVVGRGLLQYSKFFAWDETFLAHPFQSMGTANVRDLNDPLVEHVVFCWNQKDNCNRKEFRLPGSGINDIHYALALHEGKLFAIQGRTTRVWQIDSGDLLSTSNLTLPMTALASDPNLRFNSNPSSFLQTDGIGVYLQPQLGLVVGLVTSLQKSQLGTRPIYLVLVFTLDWQLVGSMPVPENKDLQQLDVYLVGPRLVLLYNDNSYSVVDLETLNRDETTWREFGDPVQRLVAFPLGSAKKEGTLVSQRTLHSQLCNSTEEQPGVYTVNCVNRISDTNIVVSHINQGKRFVQAFSFL